MNHLRMTQTKTSMNFPDLSGWVLAHKAFTMPSWLIVVPNRIVLTKSVHAARRAIACLRSASNRLIHPCASSSQDATIRPVNGYRPLKLILKRIYRLLPLRLMQLFSYWAMSSKGFSGDRFTVPRQGCILQNTQSIAIPFGKTGDLS